MRISDILEPSHIRVYGGCSSKKRLFQDMAELAGQAFDLDPSNVSKALMERESLGPTAVGGGVALPHARLAELTRVRGAFAKFEKPMDFRAADRKPVDLVFVLLAPLDASAEHLRALAVVSRVLRDPLVRDKLRANDDPATLYAILTEHASLQVA